MTRIADRKTTLKAETSAQYRRRPLMVELTPHNLIVWEKGLRERYTVPWLAVHELGLKLRARDEKWTTKDWGKRK